MLLLRTRGRVPAAELAGRLEVSVRTIYRDVEALSTAGVPVYAERGRHGGIALLPGYRTDVTGLTRDETRALFVLAARGTHADLGLDAALASGLRKMMAALPEPYRPAAELTSQRVLVDPARWMSAARPVEHLTTLQAAVFADRRLVLRYRHSGEREVRRYTLDPYGLVHKAGVWYLVADHRGAPRLYRESRVVSATVTDEPVRRRPGAELPELWEGLRAGVEDRRSGVPVRVRVRAAALDRFCGVCASNLTGPPPVAGDADHVEVDLTYRALGAARMLLAFGADAEVLDPPELRAELAAVAAEASALYA